eukprot:TRINITY_DN15174_c0_g1_i1.p1 TRINITY_DN15174_c0_g1~~TRINITY_DN15174_c0_g1_i1.p1  ORF type:complete len:1007 (-),score=181.58 TRINITY_DN15174_c0_g1_i1:249-3269(-)
MAAAQDSSGIPQLSFETKIILRQLKIWQKLEAGDIHLVTPKDVESLFDVLDPEEKGELPTDNMYCLLQVENMKLTEQDLKGLCEDADRDGSGFVSKDELFKALTTGSVALNMVRDSVNKKQKQIKKSECERPDLLDWMKEEYETMQALFSMPSIIGLFIVFTWLVSTHMDFTNGFKVHNALLSQHGEFSKESIAYIYEPERLMRCWATGKYCHWMTSGFPRNYIRQDPITDPIPGRVVTHNQMIGGTRWRRYIQEGGKCESSKRIADIYNSQTGDCSRVGKTRAEDVVLPYHLESSILIEKLHNLSESFWFGYNTESIQVQTLFVNAKLNLVTMERIEFVVRIDGKFVKRHHFESAIADPYGDLSNCIPDVLFLFLICKMLFAESKEFLTALSNGLDAVADYLGVWNVIDWVAIVGGISCFSLWMTFFVRMQVNLPALINKLGQQELDNALRAKGATKNATLAFLTEAELSRIVPLEEHEKRINEVLDATNDLMGFHMLIRVAFLIYFAVILAKLFKVFRANPRLDVVMQTIIHSWVNVVHFSIVFFALFLTFAFAGHLLLGFKFKAWATVLSALYSSWTGLAGMSEFDDFDTRTQLLAYGWTLSYEILVKKITLSMLTGLVFEAYSAVKSMSGSPQTFYAQIREAVRTLRETQNHVSLWNLVVELEDDDRPAHPGNAVTVRSLKRAFDRYKMSRSNADYIIKKVIDYATEREAAVTLDLKDTCRISGQIKNYMLKNLASADEILKHVKSQYEKALEEHQLQHALNASQTTLQVKKRPAAVENKVCSSGTQPNKEEQPQAFSQEHLRQIASDADTLLGLLEDFAQQRFTLISEITGRLEGMWQEEAQELEDLDKKLAEFDLRLQSMSRSIGSLGSSFSGANFGRLASVAETIERNLVKPLTTAFGEVGEPILLQLDQQTSMLSEKLQEVSEKSGKEKAVEIRALLWKIERHLRSFRDGKPCVPYELFSRGVFEAAQSISNAKEAAGNSRRLSDDEDENDDEETPFR